MNDEKPKPKHLSLAQFRILNRIVKGETLSVTRFRPEHATIFALARKSCIQMYLPASREESVWVATPIGKDAHAHHRAKPKPAKVVVSEPATAALY